uniref:Leucine rich repeat containing G protein-coupled receptor 5 n=1 Tax=Oncorhynchus mykiss TaxID=8022 RepID=A0A8K9XNI8_ONCMY
MFHPRKVLIILLLVVAECGAISQMGAQVGDCPSRCHCEEDGMLQRVDCSDLGLTDIPANLSVFTSYLISSVFFVFPSPLHRRLAGNDLTHIPKGAFYGLFNLKVLMLQNNQLRRVPGEALQNSRNLQSLRLDANHISSVPRGCFDGLQSLRHLWLDDNSLTEVPADALGALSSLQAMTLALNRITHIPDRAFTNLSSLVVLHLNNNRIRTLGTQCFDGLHSLETLDLNYNNLEEFPIAIRALSTLKELGFHSNNIKSIPEQAFTGHSTLLTIFFYDNPIQFVGQSAFQHLPELRTLIRVVEVTLDLLSVPSSHRDLSYNMIQSLPSFRGCEKIQKIDLHHNEIEELQADTFQGLTSLRSLDLAWNKLSSLNPLSFSSLPALIKLDLTSNRLSYLPVSGLHGLTHLKLAGNEDLQELLPAESLPKLRVMELPYAFQCCAFVSWNGDTTSDPYCKDTCDSFSVPMKHHEDFLLDFDDEPKSHHTVQCSPSPGPFRPCHHLFGSWLIRVGVWVIATLSLVCNTLVMVSIFLSPSFLSAVKLLIGLLALVNSLMGLWSATLATVDALTFGSFGRYGARWESSTGCKLTGFVSIFASETSIFLLTVAALERGLSIRRGKAAEGKTSTGTLRLVAALCFLLGLAITLLPLLGDYGVSSICLPMPYEEPSSLGFMVALVLVNSLCYLIMTVTYARLYCSLEKGEPDNLWDCSMIRHVAWLLFTNCLLYFPVAFLSFSSLLKLPSVGPEVVKSVLLVVVPLPACLNPLLYVLFNPHFREDLGLLHRRTRGALHLSRPRRLSLVSLNSEDAEKQSCDSTQALVTFGVSEEEEEEESRGAGQQPSAEAHHPPVAFIPCR